MRVLIVYAIAASPALAQTPDKPGYSPTNPTPPEALRELSTDRPGKTESPYTVDAGQAWRFTAMVTMPKVEWNPSPRTNIL